MNYKRFLGYEKGEDGKPVVNEEEAEIVRLIYRLFLNGKIKFTDIAYLNNEAMKRADNIENFTLADVLEADRRAREFVLESVN